MNDAITNATTGAEWRADLCQRYAILLLEYGRWFLLAGLIIGTIGAAVLVIRSFTATDAGGDEGGGGAPAITAIIEALKGLVEAFAKAPTWLALFGGGALLMWMAGSAISSSCAIETELSGNGSGASADQSSPEAGNAAGNATDNSSGDDEAGGGR